MLDGSACNVGPASRHKLPGRCAFITGISQHVQRPGAKGVEAALEAKIVDCVVALGYCLCGEMTGFG